MYWQIVRDEIHTSEKDSLGHPMAETNTGVKQASLCFTCDHWLPHEAVHSVNSLY